MASLLVKRLFALKDLIAEPVFYCNSLRVVVRYENGTKTDEIQGFKYLATNTDTFEQIEVFVPGDKPLIPPEQLSELQESGERIFVEFENAVVKPYYSERTKSIEDSIKADSVHLVQTK
ncbi:hypothetical protein [Mediterraneibacter gnavus]|jgi:molybdopterin-guanine dinucleotide biosynthesis protein A|uniref:hypothetical protein n=1 Tax=Mediterraneibacter gnavus TaxID=33038 RepID=UPI00366E7295